MKKILVRCDSSFKIGTGHVMRCLSLAHLIRTNKSLEVTFVCRELEGNIINLIEEKQFKVVRLPKGEASSADLYEDWRGISLDKEITQFKVILNELRPIWVIVDNYSLSDVWESAVLEMGIKILAIDDIQRSHNCQVLLDQNYYEDPTKTYPDLQSRSVQKFIGPQFALLSQSFLDQKPISKKIKNLKSILCFFGGTDPSRETIKYLNVIPKFKNISFNVVIGEKNPDLEKIVKECKQLPNAQLHIQTLRMAELMNLSDLFIGSGGSITWERCYLGLPGVSVAVAENQVDICKNLATIKAHLYLGKAQDLTAVDYEKCIESFLQNTELLNIYSKKALELKVATRTIEVLHTLI